MLSNALLLLQAVGVFWVVVALARVEGSALLARRAKVRTTLGATASRAPRSVPEVAEPNAIDDERRSPGEIMKDRGFDLSRRRGRP